MGIRHVYRGPRKEVPVAKTVVREKGIAWKFRKIAQEDKKVKRRQGGKRGRGGTLQVVGSRYTPFG